MTLEELDRLSEEMESALDELVDSSDRWMDMPVAYFQPDKGWPRKRFEMQCSFCGVRFWPVVWGRGRWWDERPFYYQAGYWFGKSGEGHYFPICSDACHDAIKRQLDKRMIHTKAQMGKIGRARRLIAECKATARRIRSEQRRKRPEGRTPIDTGGR